MAGIVEDRAAEGGSLPSGADINSVPCSLSAAAIALPGMHARSYLPLTRVVVGSLSLQHTTDNDRYVPPLTVRLKASSTLYALSSDSALSLGDSGAQTSQQVLVGIVGSGAQSMLAVAQARGVLGAHE